MEKHRAIPKGYMTVGEIAKKMGVTVRTLQHYDKEGLLSPSAESEGGRRLYTDKDFIKLYQIKSLRHLGFSLEDIKNKIMPLDSPADVAKALTEQAADIKNKIQKLSQAYEEITLLKAEVLQMQTVDFKKYADILANIQMKNEFYWLIKHFGEPVLDHIENRFDQESSMEFMNRFKSLEDEISALQKDNVPPGSEAAQSLAQSFWEMAMEFADGDMSILAQFVKLMDIVGTGNKWAEKQAVINTYVNVKFITRVMVIHVLTYCVCGGVFLVLFDYEALYQMGNVKYFMHPIGSASNFAGPVFQIVRGLLFGFILLLFKENVIPQKHGWLKLWAIIVVIGIINTPGPAPCSIEGIIYTQLPLKFHMIGAPEILVQTLLFSYLVANHGKFKSQRKYKIPLISAASAGAMFSLSGVVLALILHLDMTAAMTDTGAFIVMFVAVISVFLVSKWYLATTFRLKHIVLPLCCYIVFAIIPTIYNYVVDSIFASWLTLGINVIPAVVIFLINCKAARHSDRGSQNIT